MSFAECPSLTDTQNVVDMFGCSPEDDDFAEEGESDAYPESLTPAERMDALHRKFMAYNVENEFEAGDKVRLKPELFPDAEDWETYAVVIDPDLMLDDEELEIFGDVVLRRDMTVGVIDEFGDFVEFAVDKGHYEPWTIETDDEDDAGYIMGVAI